MKPVTQKEHSLRPPYNDCKKVANGAELGGIVYTKQAGPLYCRVGSLHNPSPSSDRNEYICKSPAPNASSSDLYSTAVAGLGGATIFPSRGFSIPTLPCPDASDAACEGLSPGDSVDSTPGREFLRLRARYAQLVAIWLLFSLQKKYPHNDQTHLPSYNNSNSDQKATTPLVLIPTPFHNDAFIFFLLRLTPFRLLVVPLDFLTFTPTRSKLLPYPRDTYFYPGRLYYDKRSRTKNIE